MNTTFVIGGVSLGLIVTILTSVLKTINLSTRWRHTIAVALSAVGGLALAWNQFNGDYSPQHLLETFSAIYASSQLIYNYLLSGTNLDQILTAFTVFGGNKDNAATILQDAHDVLGDSQDTPAGA